MRASEETTEQRHKRWCKLRGHLRTVGLDKNPSKDLLLEQEPTTRPDMPLVAYYKEIRQESLGKKTYTELLSVVVAVLVGFRVFEIMGQLLIDAQHLIGQIVGISYWLLLVAVIYWMLLRPIKFRTGRLSLNLKELSLSLPDGNRHTPWCTVYSASVDQRRRWFSKQWPWVGKKEPCVRVELDDGVVAWLYLCAAECQPLADLMTDFLLCAHNGGRQLRERAAAPEAVN